MNSELRSYIAQKLLLVRGAPDGTVQIERLAELIATCAIAIGDALPIVQEEHEDD